MILTLSCPDQRGIVAKVSAFLFERGCNILDAQQFDDQETGQFFMRVVFDADGADRDAVRGEFGELASPLKMKWTLRDRTERYRVLLLASKFDHCLADLVYRWRIGELPMDIAGVVSNHPAETYEHIDLTGLPFHHMPITKETKREQEQAIWDLVGRPRPSSWCWRVTCRSCRTRCRRNCRQVHQHPPLVPAGLQGRAALSPGPCARRQADRRHGALRDQRSRRRSDHRSGRRAHQPPRHAGRTWPQGPRHRAPRAGARHALSPGRPGAAERSQNRGVHRLTVECCAYTKNWSTGQALRS
jgi:predicted amino acid-binding ACT domain protein